MPAALHLPPSAFNSPPRDHPLFVHAISHPSLQPRFPLPISIYFRRGKFSRVPVSHATDPQIYQSTMPESENLSRGTHCLLVLLQDRNLMADSSCSHNRTSPVKQGAAIAFQDLSLVLLKYPKSAPFQTLAKPDTEESCAIGFSAVDQPQSSSDQVVFY
jgi:hypothetical protein